MWLGKAIPWLLLYYDIQNESHSPILKFLPEPFYEQSVIKRVLCSSHITVFDEKFIRSALFISFSPQWAGFKWLLAISKMKSIPDRLKKSIIGYIKVNIFTSSEGNDSHCKECVWIMVECLKSVHWKHYLELYFI